jgi:hypothetical protein
LLLCGPWKVDCKCKVRGVVLYIIVDVSICLLRSNMSQILYFSFEVELDWACTSHSPFFGNLKSRRRLVRLC